MEITRSTTADQETALACTFPARSLCCAGLILIALVSRDAVAQTSGPLINVIFSPLRSQITIQAPRDPVFRVQMRNGEAAVADTGTLVCRMPDIAQINARYLEIVASSLSGLNAVQLQRRLDSMESLAREGSNPHRQVTDGFADFMQTTRSQYLTYESTVTIRQDQLPSGPIANTLRNESAVTTLQDQPASGPFTHTYASSCLTVPEAQNLFREIRRGIRAELNLPAPTLWNR